MTEGGKQREWDKQKVFGGPRSRKESLSQSDLQEYVTVGYQIFYVVELVVDSQPHEQSTLHL